jgi:DNA invertase Pin-like site-specific DNA recombinase
MDVYLYARQSKGDASVKQQLDLGDKRAAERGWPVVGRFADKSVSATTGEPRPDYDAMMAGIRAGKAQGIVVRHYDRLYRQPRELEDLIDATEGVHLESVFGGGYDLGTADGRMQARVVGAFARGEAEKKAERQRLAALRDAREGKPRKGTPRPFGWRNDRVTAHPQEEKAVAGACHALLTGGTVTGVVTDWTARGLRPVQSKTGKWSRTSVTTILASPRIAGIATYKGTEVGRGQWDALVPEETYRAVVAHLTAAERTITDKNGRVRRIRPASQAGVRTMLGGQARCQCGNHVTGSLNQYGQPIYRCNPATRDGRPGPHPAVRCGPVDAYITEVVIARMEREDAADLAAPKADPGLVKSLHTEAGTIRKRMEQAPADWMLGKLTEAARDLALAAGQARLDEISAALEDLGRQSVLAPLAAAANVSTAWDALSVGQRRSAVDALMTVVLHPAGRGARVFDPAMVLPEGRGIIWRDPERLELQAG